MSREEGGGTGVSRISEVKDWKERRITGVLHAVRSRGVRCDKLYFLCSSVVVGCVKCYLLPTFQWG